MGYGVRGRGPRGYPPPKSPPQPPQSIVDWVYWWGAGEGWGGAAVRAVVLTRHLHARPVGGPLVPTLALFDQPRVLGPLVLVEAHRRAVSLSAAGRGASETVLLVRTVSRLAARTLLDQPRVLGAFVLVETDGGGVRLRQQVVSNQ